MLYDSLIIGSGLAGAISAQKRTERGFKCLVIDKRNHIGGNLYTEKIEDIHVHKYGIHVLHTSNAKVWRYANRFAEFVPFINSPIASYKQKLYNLPFNMNTYYQLWGVTTPEQAIAKINSQIIPNDDPQNIEEYALSTVGKDIYEKLILGYTQKQWGKHPKDLPTFIIKRLPLRFTFDNNYFNDIYQGVPKEGYTKMISNMLEGCDVILDTDYFKNREYWDGQAKEIVYTGKVDEFFDYKYGKLDYISLQFEEKIFDTSNYQGVACVNHTDIDVPYTRTIEHKHFVQSKSNKTVVTFEYPEPNPEGKEPYYPVNDEKNTELYNQYGKDVKELDKDRCVFVGRLAEYKYYDMDKLIYNLI